MGMVQTLEQVCCIALCAVFKDMCLAGGQHSAVSACPACQVVDAAACCAEVCLGRGVVDAQLARTGA
jgi:hypothetical protein